MSNDINEPQSSQQTDPQALAEVEPAEQPQDDPADAGDDTEARVRRANREAAKYRTQLRELEAEHAVLRQQVEAHARQAVEAVAAEYLQAPKLLWTLEGTAASDYVRQDGTIDRAALKRTVATLAHELGDEVRYAVPAHLRDGANSRPQGIDSSDQAAFLAK